MTKYVLSQAEIAQFQSYLAQKQQKQAEIEQAFKTIQQNQMDLEKINGAIQGTITSMAIANGALTKGVSLDSLQVGYDFTKWELTWADAPSEPKHHFKRKKGGK